MGEHADDILNGDVDEQTGEWLGEGQGFPRTMVRNHKHSGELFGVINFLKKRGITNWQLVMGEYFKQNFEITPGALSNEEMAERIQTDFGKFAKFVKSVDVVTVNKGQA